MKNIGIFHYKVGSTDGVSLEINKWKGALEKLGHRVHLCAGDLGSVEGTLIPEMFHHIPEIERINFNTFHHLRDFSNSAAYLEELYKLAAPIETRIKEFIESKSIDFLIPQNVWSVAMSPPLALALANVMREYELPALAHHHDFYWERYEGIALTCSAAVELADKCLPPRDDNLKHVVINSIAMEELRERKGITAQVVPNVFDFDGNTWGKDDYNADFRQKIGLRENDVIILQATRIVSRKGIELAVDIVKALEHPERREKLRKHGLYDGRSYDEDSRIVLVLAGYAQDDLSGQYLYRLKKHITRSGIDALFIDNFVAGTRKESLRSKNYSLWDTYVYADVVTYPSLWEGWGNQLLEAVYARLPVVVFEYPVYLSDIKDRGFRPISLGFEIAGKNDDGLASISSERIEKVADEVVNCLVDADFRKEMVDWNYEVGKKEFSLEILQRKLGTLLSQ